MRIFIRIFSVSRYMNELLRGEGDKNKGMIMVRKEKEEEEED